MRIISSSKENGFTLIELLVSIALFSVVLTVTLGSIMTIVDSNKKARSLMSVMNNLNFAVDSMTRSLKSGSQLDVSSSGDCVSTEQINYSGISDGSESDAFGREDVTYCWSWDAEEERGSIIRTVIDNDPSTSNDPVAITSPDVNIEELDFVQGAGDQPRVIIRMKGTVKISERVSSSFSIHTSVSQRQLNI